MHILVLQVVTSIEGQGHGSEEVGARNFQIRFLLREILLGLVQTKLFAKLIADKPLCGGSSENGLLNYP